MKKAADMSRDEVSAWIVALGVTKTDGNPDWARVVRASSPNLSGDAIYQVKQRWGGNPEQMQRVIAWLEHLEAKRKQPTEHGQTKKRLEEWEEIGRALAQVPELFDREIGRLREAAEHARKIAEGRRSESAVFGSITAEPKKLRK